VQPTDLSAAGASIFSEVTSAHSCFNTDHVLQLIFEFYLGKGGGVDKKLDMTGLCTFVSHCVGGLELSTAVMAFAAVQHETGHSRLSYSEFVKCLVAIATGTNMGIDAAAAFGRFLAGNVFGFPEDSTAAASMSKVSSEYFSGKPWSEYVTTRLQLD
jgi:hypothetical protein